MRYFSSRAFAADVYGEKPSREQLSLNGRSQTAKLSARFGKKLPDPTPRQAGLRDKVSPPGILNSDPNFGLQDGQIVFDPVSPKDTDRGQLVPTIVGGARAWSFG